MFGEDMVAAFRMGMFFVEEDDGSMVYSWDRASEKISDMGQQLKRGSGNRVTSELDHFRMHLQNAGSPADTYVLVAVAFALLAITMWVT